MTQRDDLGRVVIPKEIRRTLKIREGEPMEIFTEAGGSVIFRKYSPAGEQSAIAGNLCEALYRTCARPVVICDRDSVIAASGALRRELDGRPISPEIDAAMQTRRLQRPERSIPVSPAAPGAGASLVVPVIAGGDLCGCAALLESETPLGDTEVKLTQAAALFFGRQMES